MRRNIQKRVLMIFIIVCLTINTIISIYTGNEIQIELMILFWVALIVGAIGAAVMVKIKKIH